MIIILFGIMRIIIAQTYSQWSIIVPTSLYC